MIVALVALLAVQGVAVPTQAPAVTARVTPEVPAIGEPITVELRVRTAAGAEVRFPVLPDSGTRIEPLDPRAIRDASTAQFLDRTAVYRLIAWDTGSVMVALGDVTILRDGVEQRYAVTLPPLRVRSVLPADTALRVPKPARAAAEAASLRWRLWLGLAVLAALAYWGYRRWRRVRAARAARGPDPFESAQAAFAHARALQFTSAGESGRHLLLHVGILRRYLAERWPVAGANLTARELAERLPGADFPILPERVVSLAARAEAVAYARAAVGSDEAERLGAEAERIVQDLEQVWDSREEAARAAARRAGGRRRR